MVRPTILSIASVALLCAIAGTGQAQKLPVTSFSSAAPGTALPSGWQPLKLSSLKRQTEYKLVEDQGVVVLNAKAEAAASGLLAVVDFDIKPAPVMDRNAIWH